MTGPNRPWFTVQPEPVPAPWYFYDLAVIGFVVLATLIGFLLGFAAGGAA
jgi:hypothetical protein